MKFLTALLIGAAIATSASAKGAYTITTISGLLNQAETAARGVNNAGEVVGSDGATEAYPPCQSGADQAFLDKAGALTFWQVFPGCYSLAWGVATDGTIVGYAAPSSNQIEGFIRSPGGAFTGVTFPGAIYTRFYGINAKGTEYVGNEYDGSFHGFTDKGGALTRFDAPVSGVTGTSIYGVNDKGDTVGTYGTGGPSQGWTMIGGTFTTVNYPGSTSTTIFAINNKGVIAGLYNDAAGVTHGFVRKTTGKFKRFDVPGSTATGIIGLNDNGEVVGGYVKGGVNYAFYAVPN